MSDLNEQGPDEEKVKKAEKAVEDAALKMMNSHPPQFYLLKVGIGETLLSALRAERAKAAELTVEVTKLQSMHDDECYGGIDKTRLQERAESRLKAQGEALAALKEAVVDALDDINESVWADDEGNEASATAFLARAINKLSALVHAHSVARPGSASTERTKLSYLEVVKRAPRIDADDVIEHESPVAALKDKVVEGERDWIEEARKYIEEQMDRDDGNDRQECGCFWRKFTSAWGNPGHDCDSIKLIHSLAAAQAQEKP